MMSKISGHGHVSTWTDGTCAGGRMYLQNRETVKECIGGGPTGEPPMLKSDVRYLNQNIYSESVEVRRKVCRLFEEFLYFI
jgi:hypothetical protein